MDPRRLPGNLMRFDSAIPFTLFPGCG